MSITLELEGDGKKLGKICEPSYRNGPGCPLILRESSEDLLTANVFGLLRRLRPVLWLEPMLRAAFPGHHVPRLVLKDVTVALWKKLPPPVGRAGREGLTEVDVYVAFRESVLLIESKFTSGLTPGTTHDPLRDQLIRLIDVAFDHLVTGDFFPRSPFVMVTGLRMDEPRLVGQYRSADAVLRSIPGLDRRRDGVAIARLLARQVGYVSWLRLAKLLMVASQHASSLEAALLVDVAGYVRHKARAPAGSSDGRSSAHQVPFGLLP
jgi:hypothetical protein